MTIIQITNKLMKDTLIIRIQYNTNETKQIHHYPVQDCQKLIFNNDQHWRRGENKDKSHSLLMGMRII